MHRLIWAFVVRIWHKQVFSWRGSLVTNVRALHPKYTFPPITKVMLLTMNTKWRYYIKKPFSSTSASHLTKSNTQVMSSPHVKNNSDSYFPITAASWLNQQNGMCTQQRLKSAWASAQSDQSLLCPHEESLGPQLPIERTAKTLIRLGRCPGWSESSLGTQSFCWFCHEAAHIMLVYSPLMPCRY